MAKQAKLKIVVPTNFSQRSDLALDFALHYSQKFAADIYLFHVFEGRGQNFRELDKLNVEYLERMKQSVMQAINRVAEKGVNHTVEEVYRRISHGKPALEILKIASGVAADMIIMGAPSSKNFKEVFYSAPCTLVAVRDKDSDFVAE